jgi:lipoic acid synthetase
MSGRLPFWLIKKYGSTNPLHSGGNNRLHEIKSLLRMHGLNTVCESARCPNIRECFSKPTATFMILGNVCTRHCGFCAVNKGHPMPPVDDEPLKVAEVSLKLGLRHVVITSVNRDDLSDKGAGQFAKTIDAIRRLYMSPPLEGGRGTGHPSSGWVAVDGSGVVKGGAWEGKDYICPTIEVLTPDFSGSTESIRIVAEMRPEIYNHNLETIPRLYKKVRPQADYERSLNVLDRVKDFYPDIITKSGIMVGLGERTDEVIAVMRDLRKVGCNVLTIGQYLMPTKKNLPVIEYIKPDVFDYYKYEGERMGFRHVESGPFVRSSYNARMLSNQSTSHQSPVF